MASNDFDINCNIKVNASGFKKGVNDAVKSGKTLSSTIQNMVQGLSQNGLVGALSGAGLALGGVGVALGTAKKAFQAVAKVVNECTEAYKKQHIEEEQLRLAVQNSNSVTSESTRVLLDYASALQKTSNYGDEELIPMMTKLITSGRTEAETMKIMQTAIDMSATGTVSLDTAISQLNQTLNGSVGRLGMQNKELQGLTKEELENGKAVDILAKKYEGMASKSIDSSKQLKNAWGDLKETMGKSFENAMSPMKNFFATLIQGWADARKAKQDYEDAKARTDAGEGTIEDLQTQLDFTKKFVDEYEKEIKRLAKQYGASEEAVRNNIVAYTKYNDVLLSNGKYLSQINYEKEIYSSKITISGLEKRIKKLQEEEQLRNELEEQAQKQAEEEQARLDRWAQKNEDIANLKKRYQEAEQKQLITWEQNEKLLGQTVTLEEKITWYREQLVSIMAESNGLITEENQYYKDQMATIAELEEELKGCKKPAEKIVNNFEEMGKIAKNQLKGAFTDVFTKLGESLVNGEDAFEDYAIIAVSSLANILKALAEQLTAQVAVNLATGQYAKAGIALAGATATLVASGALSAMASNMSAIKEATNDATTSIEKFRQTLKEIQESRFTKTGTVSLGLIEMQEQLDTLREKQQKLYDENKSFFDYYSGGWNHSRETLEKGAKQGLPNYQKMLNLYDEYHNTIKQITEVEKQLAEALDNVRDSLNKSVAENREVINSYKDFYGASKLIVDSAGYQYQKYSTYMQMIKDEQKIALQDLEASVYDSFANFGKDIGEAMMNSFLNGGGKEDFFNNMKSYIRETVLKMAVYTESFTERLSEVGADLINALMGGGDLEEVGRKISDIYDETAKVAEQFGNKIDDIFGKIEKDMGIAISQFAKNMQSFKETIKDVSGDLGTTLIDGLTSGITQGDFLANIKDYLRKLMIQMVVQCPLLLPQWQVGSD